MEEVVGEKAGSLTKSEKALRNRFVEEYLVDYDALGAAIKLGYTESYAKDYASKFMREPYTLNRIADREKDLGLSKEEDQHRHRIIAGLYREANSRFNSGSARVAALAQLSKVIGVEAPVKTEQEVHITSDSPELGHLTVVELEEIRRKLYDKVPN